MNQLALVLNAVVAFVCMHVQMEAWGCLLIVAIRTSNVLWCLCLGYHMGKDWVEFGIQILGLTKFIFQHIIYV